MRAAGSALVFFLHFATWFHCVLGPSEFQRAFGAKASKALSPSRPSLSLVEKAMGVTLGP